MLPKFRESCLLRTAVDWAASKTPEKYPDVRKLMGTIASDENNSACERRSDSEVPVLNQLTN